MINGLMSTVYRETILWSDGVTQVFDWPFEPTPYECQYFKTISIVKL